MKNTILFSGIYAFLLFIAVNFTTAGQNGSEKTWKAGVASMVITPEEPIWMAGYAARDRPSEGTLHDLWAKALVLEDKPGNRVVLVTTDLLGFPREMSDNIRDRLALKYGMTRSEIILSSSHTHSGPVLMDALFDIYPLDETQIEIIRRYSDNLENTIVELVGQARDSMVPALLFSNNGVVRFQVNRRNNPESALVNRTELSGPNDYSVPVLKVADTTGNMKAVVFGYACHTTTLEIYQFSGDYAGFAQIELENLHPGASAMFFQGAGADQNPLPRRTVPLALQYGRELAAAVDRVLQEEMNILEPAISTAYSEVILEFTTPPDEEELIEFKNEASGYQKRWAANQLAALREKGSLPVSYPFPVQIWRLGDQLIMAMGGEVVTDYAIELKKIFGNDIFVIGYANDVMSYIPSERILNEGGYEGESSQMVYGMHSRWMPGIENKILDEFRKIAEKPGIKPVENK